MRTDRRQYQLSSWLGSLLVLLVQWSTRYTPASEQEQWTWPSAVLGRRRCIDNSGLASAGDAPTWAAALPLTCESDHSTHTHTHCVFWSTLTNRVTHSAVGTVFETEIEKWDTNNITALFMSKLMSKKILNNIYLICLRRSQIHHASWCHWQIMPHFLSCRVLLRQISRRVDWQCKSRRWRSGCHEWKCKTVCGKQKKQVVKEFWRKAASQGTDSFTGGAM